MDEPLPDELDITEPDHVALLGDLRRGVARCNRAVPDYRPIVFGGPLLDAIRTGGTIPADAALHVFTDGDIDAGAITAKIEQSGLTVAGQKPVVFDIRASIAPEWQQSHAADVFAYRSALLTSINGLDASCDLKISLDPIYITSEVAAITSALAQVDDLTYQGTAGQIHSTDGKVGEIDLRRIDADRRSWYAQAIILLADADHELVLRELDSLTSDELAFVRSLLDAHCAAPNLDEILQSLRSDDLYDHAIDARENARSFVAAIDQRAALLEPYEPTTLADRAKRFLGIDSAITVADLDLTDPGLDPREGEPAEVQAGMAKIYTNFMELRAQRLAGESGVPEPTR